MPANIPTEMQVPRPGHLETYRVLEIPPNANTHLPTDGSGATGRGAGVVFDVDTELAARGLIGVRKMPPRSRLYSLEPVGIGSPLVESATSYITRLAYAHLVSVRVLMTTEMAELLRQYTPDGQESSSWRAGDRPHRLNGSQKPARDCVSVLEQLTLRNGLSSLTMLPWNEVLSTHRLLRRTRTWCPACLETWRSARRTVYEPLLWQLQAVNVCPVHQKYLQSCCPTCKNTMPVLASQTRPGHCSRCQNWLGGPHEPQAPPLRPPSELEQNGHTDATPVPASTASIRVLSTEGIGERGTEWEMWVASAVGEMLAAAPTLEQWPKRSRIYKASVGHRSGSSMRGSAFARALSETGGDLLNSYHNRCVLEMNSLLHVCYELNMRPVAFLTGGGINSYQSTITWLQGTRRPTLLDVPRGTAGGAGASSEGARGGKGTQVGRTRPFPVEQLRRVLDDILNENTDDPPSLTSVAKQLNYDRRQLYRAFPELSKVIGQRYVEHSKVHRANVLSSVEEEVRQVTRQCYARGVEPTRRNVGSLLKKPGCMRMPMARRAWAETCRELGIEP